MKRFFLLLIVLSSLLYLPACLPSQAIQPAAGLPATPERSIPGFSTPTGVVPSAQESRFEAPTAANSLAVTRTVLSAALPATETPKPIDHKSVIVIVYDGGAAQLVYPAMAAGDLPHFSELAGQGLRAEGVQSVNPSLSAPAHAALATGAYPDQTGIPSNAFHDPSDDFYWYRLGFETPLDRIEPVWVTAQRAGLTSAALFIGGATPEFPSQAADYTVGYGIRDAYSKQVSVPLMPATGWINAPETYSPALQGNFYIPQVARLDLLVLDRSDDGQVNYDSVFLIPGATSEERTISANTLSLEESEWGPLTLIPKITAGADFLIQGISPTEVKLYYTGVYHNTAAPRALLEALNQRFGFFSVGPDDYALEHGWISATDYLEMLKRSANWMAEVSAWVYETYHPDLLYTWQDGFDSANHSFMLVDPGQSGFSPQLSQQYLAYRQQAAGIADETLATLLRVVDLNRADVLVTADHGMAPVHTDVFVNTILQRAGLLKLDRRNYVNVKTSKAIAVASGGSVNIYINQKGKEKDGIVSDEEFPEIQAEIVQLFKQLTDPETDQPVFQRVLTNQELVSIHLDTAGTGDVFAQASPGYNLNDERGKGSIFAPPTTYGGHGFDSSLPEMQAFLIAAGVDIPKTGTPIPAIKIVDIAPSVAELLGFEPAAGTAGNPIPAFINH